MFFNNYIHLVKKSDDTPVLLTKNEIRAIKKLIFSVVRKTLKIDRMNADFDACDVDLSAVLVWAIREQRLFSNDTEDMEFNIKLDGRPLGGVYKLFWSLSIVTTIDRLIKCCQNNRLALNSKV